MESMGVDMVPPRAEVRHLLTSSPWRTDSPQACPHPSWQAWSLLTVWWRGPAACQHPHTSTSYLLLLPVSKSLGKWQRVNVVQTWVHGILTWERARICSLQTLSRDWRRAFRDSHTCLLFPR